MVYSSDGILGTETVAAQQRLDSLLSNNLKQEYSKMCGFVRGWMSLETVESNTLLLQGVRYMEAHIRQIPDLADGAVMELLLLWRG